MQKQKENLFHDKFRLLNSQEHNVDIKWSSSSSSEYENTSCNEKFNNLDRNKNRKRKRKKKIPKNISNLNITIVESNREHKSDSISKKSPILTSKLAVDASPILMSTQLPPNKNIDAKSPILSNKSLCQKSPIINFKSISPGTTKVRKKLSFDKSNIKKEIQAEVSYLKKGNDQENEELLTDYLTNQMSQNEMSSVYIKSETTSVSENDSSLKLKLVEKVKSFFDSHFSSDNTSQNISDTPTPTDNSKIEEIDILTFKTQSFSNVQPSKLDSSNSDTSVLQNNAKKVKYKKGGLAYRLNNLLKKQNAHVALWQHERFLAGNSSFVIPKEETFVFRIKKLDIKYGCYMLNAIDLDNKEYLILINCKYVNTNIFVDSVFKLYEPFRILEFDKDFKIIINVCKYECMQI